MPIQHTVENELTHVAAIVATRVINGTVVTGDDIDVRTYDPGSRFYVLMNAFETDVTNTGGTFSIEESETDGGTYTACTSSGDLTATGATPGNVARTASFLPNPAKPFVHVLFTPADASTDVDVTASFVVVPRSKV